MEIQNIINQTMAEQTIQWLDRSIQSFNQLKQEIVNLVNFIKQENCNLATNGSLDDQIKRYNSALGNLNEVVSKREKINKKGKESLEVIETTTSKVNEMINFGTSKKDVEQMQHDIMEKKFELMRRQVEELIFEERQKYENKLLKILEKNEMKQLEDWTKMKVGDVIFDIDSDNYDNRQTIDSRVIGKSNLVFIVEDKECNKFGYYLSSEVQRIYNKWSPAEELKSFTFSLKSNGRLPGMMKFPTICKTYGYLMYENENGVLSYCGYDFYIGVKSKPNLSQTRHSPSVTDFKGYTNPLTGKSGPFGLKKFVIIQMK